MYYLSVSIILTFFLSRLLLLIFAPPALSAGSAVISHLSELPSEEKKCQVNSQRESAWNDYLNAYLEYREAMNSNDDALELDRLENKLLEKKRLYSELSGQEAPYPPVDCEKDSQSVNLADRKGLERAISSRKEELAGLALRIEHSSTKIKELQNEKEKLIKLINETGFNPVKKVFLSLDLYRLGKKIDMEKNRLKTLEFLKERLKHELERLTEQLSSK